MFWRLSSRNAQTCLINIKNTKSIWIYNVYKLQMETKYGYISNKIQHGDAICKALHFETICWCYETDSQKYNQNIIQYERVMFWNTIPDS